MHQKYILTTAYYLSFVILGLTISAEGPTLLQLAENTSSALDQISSIFVFSSFGYLSGSYIGGRIYDRISGHRFMAGILLVGGGLGGMIFPWMIGQAFVRLGAGAMITITFIAVILNILVLLFFIKTPVKTV